MTIDPPLHRIVAAQPYPLLFATISGAHLYGFPSPDSDFDLRGAHVLPLDKIVGLEIRDETVEDSRVIEGLEMDIVSHDVRKFFKLLLKKNGYVLEQLFSPLIVHTTPEHAELKEICRSRGPQSAHSSSKGDQRRLTSAGTGVITKHHSHHYFGRRIRGKPRHPERRVSIVLYCRPGGAEVGWSGEIQIGGHQPRLSRSRISTTANRVAGSA